MKKLFLILCIILLFTACGQQGNDMEEERQMPSKLYIAGVEEWNLEQPEIYEKCQLGRYYEAQGSIFQLTMSDSDENFYYRWGYNVNTGEDWIEEITETDFEQARKRYLDTTEAGYDTYVDYEGYRYYVRGMQIFCMDLETEKTRSVFDIIQNAVGYGVNALTVNEQGLLCLLSGNGENNEIYILSEEQPEITGDPTWLVSLTNDDSLLPQLSVEYGRMHPEMPVIYEKAEDTEDTEALRTRVLAELSAGHGPDMLWVSRDDMYVLAEKGLLQDMRELIDADTLEQIFPGVIEAGMVDGQMLGLMPQSSVFFMMTTDNIWEKESWTPQQILELIDSHSSLKGVFGYAGSSPLNMDGQGLLTELVLRDLETSMFINWDERKCSFDSDEFIKVLEIAGKYGSEETYSANYCIEALEKGEFLAWRNVISGISNYAEARNLIGDKGHFVGLPADASYSGFWVSNNFLVINKNSKHQDTIRDFLREVLSVENQGRTMQVSIRGDAIQPYMEPVSYNENHEPVYWFVNNDGMMQEVEAKPDGTSYMEEYIEFLENCGPMPYSNGKIQEIILEETELFWEGAKTAEQTAEIIQNRVQLYLDE